MFTESFAPNGVASFSKRVREVLRNWMKLVPCSPTDGFIMIGVLCGPTNNSNDGIARRSRKTSGNHIVLVRSYNHGEEVQRWNENGSFLLAVFFWIILGPELLVSNLQGVEVFEKYVYWNY